MKNDKSKDIQPSTSANDNSKLKTGKGGTSPVIMASVIGIIIIAVTIFVYVFVVSVTGGGSGGNGGNNGGGGSSCQKPTVNSYSMSNSTERIHLEISRVKIDVRKDPNSPPNDEVHFCAAMYHNSNPNEPQLLSSNSALKIHKDDIGTWQTWGKDLTILNSAHLTPNSTIAFILYEKDVVTRRENWQYTTNRCLKYKSKQNAYGTIYMSYNDFNGMQTGDTRTFNLAEGEIEVSISR